MSNATKTYPDGGFPICPYTKNECHDQDLDGYTDCKSCFRYGQIHVQSNKIEDEKITFDKLEKAGFKRQIGLGDISLDLDLDRYLILNNSKDGYFCSVVQLPDLPHSEISVVTLRRVKTLSQINNLYKAITDKELIYAERFAAISSCTCSEFPNNH